MGKQRCKGGSVEICAKNSITTTKSIMPSLAGLLYAFLQIRLSSQTKCFSFYHLVKCFWKALHEAFRMHYVATNYLCLKWKYVKNCFCVWTSLVRELFWCNFLIRIGKKIYMQINMCKLFDSKFAHSKTESTTSHDSGMVHNMSICRMICKF